MNKHIKSIILKSTGASALYEKEVIQELWSGYGKIIRVGLENAPVDSVVVKHVQLPQQSNHPRGWNTDIGHQRKVRSYQVESNWYQTYSKLSAARLPQCLGMETINDEVVIVLEDLDQAGFPLRQSSVTWEEIAACLAWLAQFHASYMGMEPDGLWEVGTYWHLETRPQELAVLDDPQLKAAAWMIDDRLNSCTHKTFVHGDAKLANFCFAHDGRVAGVDFQYVGGGCGMKDVAYFIGSCLRESECERLEGKILDTYFDYLQNALPERNDALETEWRSLYHVAWADFHRFLKGWSPDHWKINSYSERITREVIRNVNNRKIDLAQLSNIAIEAARAAGKVIQESMNNQIEVMQKKGGDSYAAQVVTGVDLASEKIILSHLLPTCDKFQIALLSEETEDDGSRFEQEYFWCIDPMDGTLAFINNYPGFSVSIALVSKDGIPQIGVVFDPSTDTLYHAVKGEGVYKNGTPWKVRNTNNYLTYVTDRRLADTPRADEIKAILEEKAADLSLTEVKEINGGGAVMNAIQVLENGPACMMKFPKKTNGGGSIWDYAATACICQELGMPATNFNGEPLDLNKKDGTFMNHEGVFFANW